MNIIGLYYDLLNIRKRHYWRKSISSSSIVGNVLMYHNITDEWTEDNVDCRCPIKVFEHYLNEYISAGFEFVTPNDIYHVITGQEKKNPFCLITFDDIPDNVFQNAYPILKKYNIPFTVFISTRYIDYINPNTKQPYITSEHLMELDADPLCTVGAHSTSHNNLRYLHNSLEDLKMNKEFLEQKLGHSVEYLAYPYGTHVAVSRKNQREAEKLGFKCAFGTINAPITDISAKNLFFLPRMIKN